MLWRENAMSPIVSLRKYYQCILCQITKGKLSEINTHMHTAWYYISGKEL